MESEETLKGKKVLYVEDDAFFADLMSEKLSGKGCIMLHAVNGEQAMACLEKEVPDLVILDIMLPGGIDGFSILEKLKANPSTKNAPVVILSNLDRLEDVEKGMQLGAFRYMTKSSVSPSDVVAGLELALHSSLKM